MTSETSDIKTTTAELPVTDGGATVAAEPDGHGQNAAKPATADDGRAAEAPLQDHPTALERLKSSVSEDDPKPSPTLTLGKIIGGDIFSNDFVRRQIWLFLLIMAFTILYVAFRYQCQQDMITIDKLETDLKDAKYRALSSSSTLTERCRESHVLELLKANNDSLLHIAEQPPFIIEVPEE